MRLAGTLSRLAWAEGHDPKAMKVREVMMCEEAVYLDADPSQTFSGARGNDSDQPLHVAPP